MRAIIVIALALGACSGPGEQENRIAPVADGIEAGLWEISHEVASIRATDQAASMAVKAKAGDRNIVSHCVGEADRARPAPALFVGEDYACEYRDSYIKSGRISATLACTRPGTGGNIMMNVDGNHEGTGLTGTVNATSYLTGEGDFRMETRIKGRHIGDCPVDAAGVAAPKG